MVERIQVTLALGINVFTINIKNSIRYSQGMYVCCTVNSIFHYTHILKASGCLEVKEWELGDLKDTKYEIRNRGSSFYQPVASGMRFFSSENDPLANFQPFSPFFHASWCKKKNLLFLRAQRVQKSSKLSENDILYIYYYIIYYILYILYLKNFLNYGAKQPSQKKVMRVQKDAFFSCKNVGKRRKRLKIGQGVIFRRKEPHSTG